MNEKGAFGEDFAKNYFIENNYTILKKNYYSRFGEIDLILKKDEYIVFVEVKLRSKTTYGKPYEFVDRKKQERIILTAKKYISENNITDMCSRFDIFEILQYNDNIMYNHIENAFTE